MAILEYLSARINIDQISDTDIAIPCPSCGKEKRHFQVSLIKPISHCFRCGYSTDWIGLVSQVGHISLWEAKEIVAAWSGNVGLSQEEEIDELLPMALPPEGQWTMRGRKYLQERGISQDTIDHFGLYYCSSGYFSGRIIIPVKMHRVTVGFQARTIFRTPKRYLFPKGNPSGRTLLNYDSIKRGSDVVLVEGPFDCMKVWQAGFPVVASFGKNLTNDQIKLLGQLEPNKLITLWDSEVDPRNNIWEKLRKNFTLQVADVREGDPGDCDDIESVIRDAEDSPLNVEWNRFLGGMSDEGHIRWAQ